MESFGVYFFNLGLGWVGLGGYAGWECLMNETFREGLEGRKKRSWVMTNRYDMYLYEFNI